MDKKTSPNMKKVILEISNINKSYDKNQVLNNINLDVFAGELLVLLGPSGCGKTTLLRIINGQIESDSGLIKLNGKDISNVPCSKRDMGFVFQSYALFPHMDVSKNIGFGLRMRKTPDEEIEKKINSALETVHLKAMGKRKINELSGGQQQRVALARALVLHPSLLLLDEPLSNLDAKLRANVRVEIAQIQKNLEITTIMVTHDQVEAMTMGDRIALMQDGVIQQVSKPIDIYEFPANTFIASFVGSPSINFFQLTINNDKARFMETGVELPKESFSKALKADLSIKEVSSGEFLFGVRPEDLLIFNYHDEDKTIFQGKITFIEALGSESLVHLEVNNYPLISRLPRLASELNKNDTVFIGLRDKSCHIFEMKTGKRLGL